MTALIELDRAILKIMFLAVVAAHNIVIRSNSCPEGLTWLLMN
jgi:hypothetical protein